jgi:hypothetical protein
MPDAKIAILYQNDDLGKDFINGFKAELKEAFDSKVVASSYEVNQPTIDSQIVSLKSSGATVMLFAGTPKFLRRRSARRMNPAEAAVHHQSDLEFDRGGARPRARHFDGRDDRNLPQGSGRSEMGQ